MASTFDTPPTVGLPSDGTKSIPLLGNLARILHLRSRQREDRAYPWSSEAFDPSGSTYSLKDSEEGTSVAPEFNLDRVERVS
jgi:hypothetical protein